MQNLPQVSPISQKDSRKIFVILCSLWLFLVAFSCFSQSPHQLYIDAFVKDSLKDFDGALTDLDKAIGAANNNDTLHMLHAKVEAETNHTKEAFCRSKRDHKTQSFLF